MKHNRTLLVYLLGLGVFAAVITGMEVIGVLPQLAEAFGVSSASTGVLVSVYALVVAVTGPMVSLVTARLDRNGACVDNPAVRRSRIWRTLMTLASG